MIKWLLTFLAVILLMVIPVMMLIFIIKFWKLYIIMIAIMIVFTFLMAYTLNKDRDDFSL